LLGEVFCSRPFFETIARELLQPSFRDLAGFMFDKPKAAP
jgi:hypothetical protein